MTRRRLTADEAIAAAKRVRKYQREYKRKVRAAHKLALAKDAAFQKREAELSTIMAEINRGRRSEMMKQRHEEYPGLAAAGAERLRRWHATRKAEKHDPTDGKRGR